MELNDWQIRLEKHFGELRKGRSTIASGKSVFGLEHGLTATELKDLSGAIREQILAGAPSCDHRLAWIVYASELGYVYAGDEYWQTFEEETPGWIIYGERPWLRDCFFWFHEEFGGVKPSGRWAEHFSIICWPITHAVLPRDLQRQLARILFDLRHSFSAELFESPLMLGEFIAARSWNATSRFQNLAEETQLVGQIAAALLLQGEFGSSELLYPPTLQRIGDDLDRERRAREWLRSARRFAKERARIRGLTLSRSQSSSVEPRPEDMRAEAVALGIEPRLILRPTDTQGTSWVVSIEIPDLSHLLLRFPRLRDIFIGSRCVISCSSGRPLARGRLLHGAQRVAIAQWPQSDEVLLQFEQTDPQLEYLLRTECLLRPGPIWLFRIASDGLAYEVRSLRIRPGDRYVVISSARSLGSSDYAQPVELSCDGAYGALIELPAALTEEWEEELRALGLSQAKTIEVWPAGLGAVVWDGEGYGEWLASEQPCIAIRSDHPIDYLFVSMGIESNQSIEIAPVIPGEFFFVELPELPVGIHTVHFLTRHSPSGENEPLGDLDVVMRIREARPWSPGISPQGPLLVHIDPVSPTLEQLWEGRIDVTLQGPEGRKIECKLTLFEKVAETATLIKSLPPLELPVSQDNWRDYFEKYFKKSKEAEIAYDATRACELRFTAEEIGAFSIRFEREFAPLRWTVRRDKQGYITRIFDDSGSSTQPIISYYSFEEPLIEERLDYDPVFYAADVGGLCVARQGDLNASIIIPPAITMKEFSALRCSPRFETPDCSTEAVIRLLSLTGLWSNARLPGDPVSTIRQRDVLLAFIRQVFLILGGKNWFEAETLIHDEKCGLLDLKEEISKRGKGTEFATCLTKKCASLAYATCKQRIKQFKSISVRFLHLKSVPPEMTVVRKGIIRRRTVQNADNPFWLCELALRLACDPSSAEVWAGDGLCGGIERLLEEPTLSRGARFLVIAIDQQLDLRATHGKLYSGWEWT